jgi:peroxiredoxin Q/BCP
MAQLRQDHDQFNAQDTVVVVVGPENDAAFQKYFQDNDLPFIGLPDPDHSVLKLYGQEVKLFKFGRMPAMAVIDKAGIVRFVHYGHDMSDIPANEEVLATLKEINAEPIQSA